MAKGDDSVLRKKNKVLRKRMRNSESSVSARVAAIIATKRRRKAGNRRKCEGMCFSLPTEDDPFNERHSKPDQGNKKHKHNQLEEKPENGSSETNSKIQKREKAENFEKGSSGRLIGRKIDPLKKLGGAGAGYDASAKEGCPSKFILLCLNAMEAAWKEDEESGAFDGSVDGSLRSSKWGIELWRCFSSGLNIVDTSESCAIRKQVTWLASMACDAIARKEKQGLVVSCPFLVYIVPSQEKAIQVRSVCKPLKDFGIHTVSLHPGASLDHQIYGLKSCEPEFLVSTPERLLELVSLGAIDISGTSLLVLDGLKSLIDFGFVEKIKCVREHIKGDPQTVTFGDCYGGTYTPIVQNLLRGPVYRLSLHDSITSRSAFISQHIHYYTSEEEKTLKVKEILTEVFNYPTPSECHKVLFIASTTSKAEVLTSNLKSEGFSISDDSNINGSLVTDSEKVVDVLVKDLKSVRLSKIEEFEIVVFVDFPSIEDYVDVLTKIARYSVAGMLHSFLCKADASMAHSLMKVLEQCGQSMPETLRKFDRS